MRHLFPALQQLAYLNAAASSPIATPVAEAAIAQLRESVAEGDVHFPRWLEHKERLRARLARFIGAAPTQVAFTPSTSMGFCAVAELFWRRGVREVLTLEGEFPSTTVPFLARGMSLRVVKPRPDGTYRVEDLDSGDAVALSAVQFGSGARLDVEQVAALCRARKVPFAVNVAQALGQVPFAVGDVDFMCGTSHKWLMGGYGVGLFYAKAGWLEEHGLPWAGWLSAPDALRWQAFPGARWAGPIARGVTLRPQAQGLEAGGGSWPALYAFDAALGLLEGHPLPAILEHNLKLQALLRAGLERRGLLATAPAMSGICVVKVAGDAAAAVRELFAEGVVVTPRAGGVRFSTHIFNDESDVQRALEAVDRVKLSPPP